MPFSDYLPKLVPGWLQQTTWGKYLGATAAQLDAVTAATKAAIKSRFPDYAADDALGSIGGERQLPRGASQSSASYAAVLKGAWDLWHWGGTAYGLLKALAAFGYPTAKVGTVTGMQYALDGSGNLVVTRLPLDLLGTWLLANDRSFWSKFVVIFSQPDLPASWVPTLPASNSTEVEALRALIKRWRPGFATCGGIVVITAGRSFGYPPGVSPTNPGGLTFGTLAASGFTTFGGNTVTLWTVPN